MTKLSNSPLVSYTRITSFKSVPRTASITKITPHHVGGNATVEALGQVFATPGRNASSNYGIGSDGRIGMYVEEKDRSWCSSSSANDNTAVTMEIANNSGDPSWTVSDAAWEALIKLCVDICRRNPGIKQKDGRPGLYCDGTPNASLTFHRYFAATGCAQPYIWNRRQQLCDEVNKRLGQKDKEEEEMAEPVYKEIEDVPSWGRPTVEKLVKSGALQGDDSGLNLPYTMLRILAIHDRMGLYDK